MNKLLCFLLLVFIGSSCQPTTKENPLKIIEKGLWIPILETPFSYQIIRESINTPDSTFAYTIPCWIVGANEQMITERTPLNYCTDHKLTPNKDGEWEIERYGCRIKTDQENKQLICSYKDAKGKIHEIKYRHCLKNSSFSLDQFWALDDALKNTLWKETSSGEQQKYYIFTADVGIENKPNSHQKIYKYPMALDAINQQLSEDRSEFRNLELLFNNDLVFLYFEAEKSITYVVNQHAKNELKLLKIGAKDRPIIWTRVHPTPPVIDSLIHRFNTVKSFQ